MYISSRYAEKFQEQTGVCSTCDVSKEQRQSLQEQLKQSVRHPIDSYQLIKRSYFLFRELRKATEITLQHFNGMRGLTKY